MSEKKYDALKLSKQLCFPLYACSREMIKLYKPWLDELGLTYTQYITMMVLWEHHATTVKSLGQELYLDSGTLTPLLKKLEEKGLVTRRRSEQDERNLIVTLTEKGEEIAMRIYDRHKTIMSFLTAIGVEEGVAREDACKIEHDISEESFNALRKHLLKL